jgi:excisionase family DNA binding protein
MNSAQEDEYLTVAEIATRFKINPQTVRNWISQDQLRAVRLRARRVRVLGTDLDRFLAATGATARPDPSLETSAPPSIATRNWPQHCSAPEPHWPPIARPTLPSHCTRSSPLPSHSSTAKPHTKAKATRRTR